MTNCVKLYSDNQFVQYAKGDNGIWYKRIKWSNRWDKWIKLGKITKILERKNPQKYLSVCFTEGTCPQGFYLDMRDTRTNLTNIKLPEEK